MGEVEIVHWNPKRRMFKGGFGRRLPIRRRLNNFGDLLGPLIVERICDRLGLSLQDSQRSARLLTVGSIMHKAQDGDVIWGTGVNGKVDPQKHLFDQLDVRAVRGPLTAEFLRDLSIDVPDVFGDPALLLGHLFPEVRLWTRRKYRELTVVPNMNDLDQFRGIPEVVNPRSNLWDVVRTIAQSRLVVGSSLHAIVVADALGIPARVLESQREHPFKYSDYYQGTGREFQPATTIREAKLMGGAPRPALPIEALMKSFPADLWQPQE